MKIKLFLIRKTKALFLKWKLHVLFEPFSGFFINLAYLSKLSKWRAEAGSIPSNDFYTHKVDYDKRYDLYKYVLERENLNKEIDYFEFGVAGGFSFKWWLANNKNQQSK